MLASIGRSSAIDRDRIGDIGVESRDEETATIVGPADRPVVERDLDSGNVIDLDDGEAVVDAAGHGQAAIHEHQGLGQLAAQAVLAVRLRRAQAHVDPLAVPPGFGVDLVEIALLARYFPVEPVVIAVAAYARPARERAVAPAVLGIAPGTASDRERQGQDRPPVAQLGLVIAREIEAYLAVGTGRVRNSPRPGSKCRRRARAATHNWH